MPRERSSELFPENPPLSSPARQEEVVERIYESLRRSRNENPIKDDLVYFLDHEHGELPYLVLEVRPHGKLLVMSVEDGRRVFETPRETVVTVMEFEKEMKRVMEGKVWH